MPSERSPWRQPWVLRRTAHKPRRGNEGISVNLLVSSALAEKLSALDAERYLSERAGRGKKVDIDAILAKIPLV